MSISRGPARKVTVDSAKLVSTTSIPSTAANRLIGKRLSVFDRLGENHVKHQENGDFVISQERKISLSVARCKDSDDIMSEKKKEISFTMKKKNGNLGDSDKVLKKQKKVDTGPGEASPLKKKKDKTKEESAQEGTQLQSSVQQATKNDSEGEIRKKVDTKKKKKTVGLKQPNDEKVNTQEVKANKKNKNVKAKDGTKKQENQSTKGGAKKLVEYVSEESDIEVEKKKKKKLKKGKELKSSQEKKSKKGCDSEDDDKSSKKKKKKKNKAVSDYDDTDDDESSHETHAKSKNKKRERSQSWTSSNSDEEANTKSKKKIKNKSSDEKNKFRKFEMSPVRISKNDATPLNSPSLKSAKKKDYSSYESASSYDSDHDQRKRKKKKNKTKSEAGNQQQYSRGRSASPDKKLHSNIRKRERSRSNETNERRVVKVMRYDEHIGDLRSGTIDVRQHFKPDARMSGTGYGKTDESLHSSQVHPVMMAPPIMPLQRTVFEDYEGTQQRGRVETFVDVTSNWHEHLNRQLREGGRRRSIDPYDRDSRPPVAATRTDSYPSLSVARDQSLTRDQRYTEERRDDNQDFYRDDNRRRDVNTDGREGDFHEASDNWNQTSGYSETQRGSYQQQERNNNFDTRGDFRENQQGREGREGTTNRGGANQNCVRRDNLRQKNQTRDTNRDSGRDFESSYNNDDRFNQRDGNYQNDTQTGQYQQNQFDQRRAYSKDDNSGDRERGNTFRNNNGNQTQNQNRMNSGRHHHQMYDNFGKLRFSLSPIRDPKLVSDSIEERLQSDNEDDDKNKKKNPTPEKDSKTDKSEKSDKVFKPKLKKEEKKEDGSAKSAESDSHKKKVEKTDKKTKKIDKEKEKEKYSTVMKIVSNVDKGATLQKVSQKVDKPDAANDHKSSTTDKKKDKKSTKDKEVKKDAESKTNEVSSIKYDKPGKVKKENLKKEETLENKETKDSTQQENKGVPTESVAPSSTITDNKSENKKEKSDESKIDSKPEKESKKERKDRTKDRNDRESSVSSKRSVSSRDGKRERSVERGRKRSPDSKRGKSPTESKKTRNKSADRAGSRRGRSTERRDNWRSHNSPNVRNSPAFHRDTDSNDRKRRGRSSECGSERVADEKRTHDRAQKDESTTKEGNANKKIDNMLNDVYESISDEELDLFDDDDLEGAPVPASVIDIDWGMMASLASSKKKESEENSQMPAYRRNLKPGAILSKIGFSSNLLSAATLKAVQEKVLEANNLTREGLAPSEQHILDHGTAAMTQTCFRRRRAHEDLLKRRLVDVIGMRNDLEVRRDLRKPLDKIGSRFDTFCVPPTIPADAEMFTTATSLYRKKPQVEGDPVYVTIPSKIGSLVMCKS